MEKSIQERATALGVPVIEPIHWVETPIKSIAPTGVEEYKSYLNSIEAICGGCGKDLFRGHRREPCGHSNCPFGLLTNHQ